MNAQLLDLNGKALRAIELPAQFDEPLRPDLIRRAVHAEHSLTFQPKGAYLLAGLQTTAAYYGRRHAWRQTINTGRSRLPREKIAGGRSGKVRIVPHAVKGRRAHPPKPSKILAEHINRKEKNAAIRSAMSATVQRDAVAARGHQVSQSFPLIVDNALESVSKAKQAKQVLETLGLGADLQRAHEGRRMRSGRSRLRKGGYKTPRSCLIVVGDDKGIWHAARNLPGVNVAKASELSADLLAPGGVPGRVTLWTESAVEKIRKENLYA